MSDSPILRTSNERSREQLVKYLDHLAREMRGNLVSSSGGVSMRIVAPDAQTVQQAADLLRGSSETFHVDPTGKTREPPHCPSCDCGTEPAVHPDSDAEVFTRAVVADVARWEFFSGSTDQGEVCVGGLRYATRLDVGVPILGASLREALEKHTCWKAPTQKAKVQPWPWPMCKGCGNEPNACTCDTQSEGDQRG